MRVRVHLVHHQRRYVSGVTNAFSLPSSVTEQPTDFATIASEKCQQEKRKTVNGEDILFAMTSLGFENYGEALKIYLARYREVSFIIHRSSKCLMSLTLIKRILSLAVSTNAPASPVLPGKKGLLSTHPTLRSLATQSIPLPKAQPSSLATQSRINRSTEADDNQLCFPLPAALH